MSASADSREGFHVYGPAAAKGGVAIKPETTAVLFIEFQNEFATEKGKLYPAVAPVMKQTDMLNKAVKVAAAVREAGGKVMHTPIILAEDGSDNPNKLLGILGGCYSGKLFVRGSWNADFCEPMKPQDGDIVINGKRGLDAFPGSDLHDQLKANGVETLAIGGFLTNCCCESTMRTAYEKGFNVITLTDCMAATSVEGHAAATTGTFGMFSTPMTGAEFTAKLQGLEAPQLELTYFDVPGRAEPVRIALHAGGQQFKDNRLAFPEYKEAKQKGMYATGIPVLKLLSGQEITQSAALLRYAGKLGDSGLYPSDPEQALRVDEMLDICADITNGCPQDPDKEIKKKKREEYAAGKMKKLFELLVARLALSEGPFLLGNQLSVAELAAIGVYAGISSGTYDFIAADYIDQFPSVVALNAAVREHDFVKAYYASLEKK